MSAKIRPFLMLVVGVVVGGGLVMFLQRDRSGDAVSEENVRDAGAPDAPVAPEVAEVPRVPNEARQSAIEQGGDLPPDEKVDGDAGGDGSFEKLMARVFSGDADDDEQLEFWEQLRKTDKIDGVIASLREQVDQDERDVTGRMTLAQLYVMKLLSAPSGPERGLLSEMSQALWGQVLELEPDNFEAQYSIAFSLSQYPDFLNKTDAAIEAFEKAIVIEERVGASEQTAQAYVNLARIHQKGGDPASALEVLERAVTAHPDNAVIGSQLEKLKKGFVFEEQ